MIYSILLIKRFTKQMKELTVVPAYFEKKFLEFALRSTGGGFIRELSCR